MMVQTLFNASIAPLKKTQNKNKKKRNKLQTCRVFLFTIGIERKKKHFVLELFSFF